MFQRKLNPYLLNALKNIPKCDQHLLTDGVRRLISILVEDFDVLPIIAIGNEGPGKMCAPGHFPETLSVGAVDFNHEPACFSGGGTSPTGGGNTTRHRWLRC